MLGKGVTLLSLPLLLISSITIHSDICRVPTLPTITAPATGVEFPDPTIIVEGATTQHSTITLTTNDRPLGSTTSDASGDFQMQVTLDRGENHLSAQTSNPCGTSGITSVDVSVTELESESPTPDSPSPSPSSPLPDRQTFIPDTLPGINGNQQQPAKDNPSSSQNDSPSQGLALRITSPDDHSTTTDDSIFLTGITNRNATEIIEVNNKETASLATPSNTFGVLTPLHMGKNTIKVTATADNQSAVAVIHVTRTNPSPQHLPWYEAYWYVLAVPALLLSAATLFGIVIKRRHDEI